MGSCSNKIYIFLVPNRLKKSIITFFGRGPKLRRGGLCVGLIKISGISDVKNFKWICHKAFISINFQPGHRFLAALKRVNFRLSENLSSSLENVEYNNNV